MLSSRSILFLFSLLLSALNDLTGPSAGPLARTTYSYSHQGEGSGGDSGSLSQGYGRACTTFSRVLQPHVCGHQGVRRVETYHCSLHPEPVSGEDAVSYGDCPVGSLLGAEERLGGLYPLEGRVPSGADSPSSRKFLGFTAGGRAWQFKVLCFGLSTAPQAFTQVMAPVSSFLHQSGVRMLQYLDDRLILASSREKVCWARDKVLSLCQDLGIVVNLDKSSLVPTQAIVYLGIKIESQTFQASLTPLRIEKFFSIAEEFLSSKVQSAKFWGVPLGHLTSLTHLVPGGRLQMRALQLAFKRSWDFRDDLVLIPWDSPSRDLLWWCSEGCLEEGGSLAVRSPDLMFWSDASDQDWGATLADQFTSGLWLEGESFLSVNHRELLAVQRGLCELQDLLFGQVVAVFSDNTTAVPYLRRPVGTFSPVLNEVSQQILRWAELKEISILPQFFPGRDSVVRDALSRPNQVIGAEWTLHQEVFDWLCKRWPVTIDPFASFLNHRCGVYFVPVSDPMAAGTDAILQSWDFLQAYAFPPFTMIPHVLVKLRSSLGTVLTLILPFCPQREWFPDLLDLLLEPPLPLPNRWDLLLQPHIRRFHQNLPVLRLHAWRLSSGSPENPASL